MEAVGLGGAKAEPGFEINVRGQKLKYGDPIVIELSSGDVSATVMNAEMESVASSFGSIVICGSLGSLKLARLRSNQSFENQTMGKIVRNLAGQASVNTGQVDDGSNYAYFVASESTNALRIMQDLASREAMDFYCDETGALIVKEYKKTSADHTLYFGIDILDLVIANRQAPLDRVWVFGESPSSKQGSDTWHWISKDWSPFRGESGKDGVTWAKRDGAIRTKDAAGKASSAWFGGLKDRSKRARMITLGRPDLKLGDAVEIKNAEKPEMNGLFKIISARHVYNKQDGYITICEITGGGGAQEAKSLLGAAVGQLAGALG